MSRSNNVVTFKAKGEPREIHHHMPPLGYAGGETLSTVSPEDDLLSAFDIHAGDLVVLMSTTDVQDFDLAYAEIDGDVHVGRCYTKRGRVVIENARDVLTFKRSDVEGRVVGVLRGDFYRTINYPLRHIANEQLDRIQPINDLIN